MMLSRLSITDRQFHFLASRVAASPTSEICGVLGGALSVVRCVCIVSNISENPSKSFFMEPKQLFRIMLYLDKMGLQILAFFHSHPEGGSGMLSERDVREHHYPDAQSVVLVAEHGRLISLRVFQLSDKATKEFPIQIRGG